MNVAEEMKGGAIYITVWKLNQRMIQERYLNDTNSLNAQPKIYIDEQIKM
jgi:hypothetical protein